MKPGLYNPRATKIVPALLIMLCMAYQLFGLSISLSKIHSLRARALAEEDGKKASAEWARARVTRASQPRTPAGRVAETLERSRSSQPIPLLNQPSDTGVDCLDVAALYAAFERNGISQSLYRRARELLKFSDCSRLHSVLLNGAWTFGRNTDALFHYERADLSFFQRGVWFFRLLPIRISSAELSDWAKFALWIVLVIAVLVQIRDLRRGENSLLSFDGWPVLDKFWTRITGLLTEMTERRKRSPASSDRKVSPNLVHASASQNHGEGGVERVCMKMCSSSVESLSLQKGPVTMVSETALKTASYDETGILQEVREADAGGQKPVVVSVHEDKARTLSTKNLSPAVGNGQMLAQPSSDTKLKNIPAWRVSKPMSIQRGQPVSGSSVRPSEKTEGESSERQKKTLLEALQTPLVEDDDRP